MYAHMHMQVVMIVCRNDEHKRLFVEAGCIPETISGFCLFFIIKTNINVCSWKRGAFPRPFLFFFQFVLLSLFSESLAPFMFCFMKCFSFIIICIPHNISVFYEIFIINRVSLRSCLVCVYICVCTMHIRMRIHAYEEED